MATPAWKELPTRRSQWSTAHAPSDGDVAAFEILAHGAIPRVSITDRVTKPTSHVASPTPLMIDGTRDDQYLAIEFLDRAPSNVW